METLDDTEIVNNQADLSPIEWDALEYVSSKTNIAWYIIFGIVIALTVGYSIYSRDYFGAGFGVILAICLFYYKSQKPKMVHYGLTPFGLSVGDVQYPYNQIHSFSLDLSSTPKKINFVFTRKYLPELSVILEEVDPESIRKLLDNYILELPSKENGIIERIIRLLRLQ